MSQVQEPVGGTTDRRRRWWWRHEWVAVWLSALALLVSLGIGGYTVADGETDDREEGEEERREQANQVLILAANLAPSAVGAMEPARVQNYSRLPVTDLSLSIEVQENNDDAKQFVFGYSVGLLESCQQVLIRPLLAHAQHEAGSPRGYYWGVEFGFTDASGTAWVRQGFEAPREDAELATQNYRFASDDLAVVREPIPNCVPA